MVLKIPDDSLQKVEIASTVAAFFKPVVESRSGTLESGCGGILSYSLDFIEKSRLFNGSFVFENYCDHGITISGETDIDGTYEVGIQES